MPKSKVLILDSKDLTAKGFATTLKNIGTVTETVDFATSILADPNLVDRLEGLRLPSRHSPSRFSMTIASSGLAMGTTRRGLEDFRAVT
jgi:hypothetical protein